LAVFVLDGGQNRPKLNFHVERQLIRQKTRNFMLIEN